MQRSTPTVFEQSLDGIQDSLVTSVDGELMTNYLPCMPVSAGQHIEAGQDEHGEPMVLSIGGDQQLYLICRDQTSSSGWKQVDLSSCLGSDFEAQAFGLGQSENGALTIALAGVRSGNTADVEVYLTGYLDNDPAASFWNDFASQWVPRTPPSQDETALISRFLIGDNNGTDAPMVIAQTNQDGNLGHFFINGDVNDDSWTWKAYPLPNDADQILDLVIGKTSYGAGTFALYQTAGVLNLVFTSIPNQYDSTYNVPLTAPAEATCLAAIPDPQNANYSKLFVGGQGLSWFNSDNLSRDAVSEPILSSEAFPNIYELLVRQDSDTIALWFNNHQEDLYYMFAPQASNEWSIPLLLRQQTAQIAALRNQIRQTNEVFFVGGDNTLGYLRQDPLSTLWREIDIPLEDTGTVQEVQCYTTSVQFADANSNPLINVPIGVNASEWAYTQVNGNLYILDDNEDAPITVHTDALGYLTLINQVGDLSTPVYTFQHPNTKENLIANPSTKVTEGLAAIQSGDDLKNATNQLGEPVITGDYSDDVFNYAAYSIGQLSTIMAQLPANGSDYTGGESTQAKQAYVPRFSALPKQDQLWGMTFGKNGPELHTGNAAQKVLQTEWGVNVLPSQKTELGVVSWIEGVFGNIMQALETAAEDIFGFFVEIAEDAFHFLVKIGEAVFKVAIKALAQAMKIVNWVFEFLFGISLQDLIKWLGFLFDWGDIVTTHQVFANVANQTLNLLQADTQNAVSAIQGFFDGLEDKVAGMAPLPSSVSDTNVKSSADSSIDNADATGKSVQQFATNSVPGNFANYQLMHSGAADYDDPTDGSGSGPVVTFITEVVEPALADIYALVGDVVKDLMLLFEGGDLTIGQAMAVLASDVVTDLLQTMEDLLVGLIETGAAVAKMFQDTLNHAYNIPFLTAFYKLIAGGDDMSLLDGMCLLAAIPSTIGYKMVAGEAPFEDGTYGLDTDGYQQLFATLSGNDASSMSLAKVLSPTLTLAAEDEEYSTAQKVYSQVGGICFTLTSFLSGGLDVATSLAEGEIKFASELQLVSSLVGVASAFPIDADTTQRDLDYGVWCFDIMGLLIGFCTYLTPRAETPEVETFIEGPFEILEAIVDLVLYSVSFGLEIANGEDDAWGWDAEKYIQNLLKVISKAASGVSKIDEDPVSEAVEQAIAGGTLLISGVLNLTRITNSIQQDMLHQNY